MSLRREDVSYDYVYEVIELLADLGARVDVWFYWYMTILDICELPITYPDDPR